MDKYNKQIPFSNKTCHIWGSEDNHKGQNCPQQIWGKWKYVGHSAFGCGKIEFKTVGKDLNKLLQNDHLLKSLRENEKPPQDPTFYFETPIAKTHGIRENEMCSVHLAKNKWTGTNQKGWLLSKNEIQKLRKNIIKKEFDKIKSSSTLSSAFHRLRSNEEYPTSANLNQLSASEIGIVQSFYILRDSSSNSNPFCYKCGLNTHKAADWKSFTVKEIEKKGVGVLTQYIPANINNCSNSVDAAQIEQRIQENQHNEDFDIKLSEFGSKSDENEISLNINWEKSSKSKSNAEVHPNWGIRLQKVNNLSPKVDDVDFKNLHLDTNEIWKMPVKTASEKSADSKSDKLSLYKFTTQDADAATPKKPWDYNNRMKNINKFRMEAKQNVQKVIKDDSTHSSKKNKVVDSNTQKPPIEPVPQNQNINSIIERDKQIICVDRTDLDGISSDNNSWSNKDSKIKNKSELRSWVSNSRNSSKDKQKVTFACRDDETRHKFAEAFNIKIEDCKQPSEPQQYRSLMDYVKDKKIAKQELDKRTSKSSESVCSSKYKKKVKQRSIEKMSTKLTDLLPQSEEIKLNFSESSSNSAQLSKTDIESISEKGQVEQKQDEVMLIEKPKNIIRKNLLKFDDYAWSLPQTSNEFLLPYPLVISPKKENVIQNKQKRGRKKKDKCDKSDKPPSKIKEEMNESAISSRSSSRRRATNRQNNYLNSDYLVEIIDVDDSLSSNGDQNSDESYLWESSKKHKRKKRTVKKQQRNC